MVRNIHELHRARCHEAGNVNEHLPLLYMLSVLSSGVTEIGIERGCSTSAIIAGQDTRAVMGLPASYRGIDINKRCEAEIERLRKICQASFLVEFICSKGCNATPTPCDMLFIDSLHTEECVRAELLRHAGTVGKYIALHDTATFGENGETEGTRGLLYGIDELLTDRWLKVYDSPRNNGLAVFQRTQGGGLCRSIC